MPGRNPCNVGPKKRAIVFISSVTGQRGGGILAARIMQLPSSRIRLTKSLARAYGPWVYVLMLLRLELSI